MAMTTPEEVAQVVVEEALQEKVEVTSPVAVEEDANQGKADLVVAVLGA